MVHIGVVGCGTGDQPPVTAAVGERTLAVLDAARQSALKGRSITLEGN